MNPEKMSRRELLGRLAGVAGVGLFLGGDRQNQPRTREAEKSPETWEMFSQTIASLERNYAENKNAFDRQSIEALVPGTHVNDRMKTFIDHHFVLVNGRVRYASWGSIQETPVCLMREDAFFEAATNPDKRDPHIILNLSRSEYTVQNFARYLEVMSTRCPWLEIPPAKMKLYASWLHEYEHVKGSTSEIAPVVASITKPSFPSTFPRKRQRGLQAAIFFPDFAAELAKRHAMPPDAYDQYLLRTYGQNGAPEYKKQSVWFENALVKAYPKTHDILAKRGDPIAQSIALGRPVFNGEEENFDELIEILVESGK